MGAGEHMRVEVGTQTKQGPLEPTVGQGGRTRHSVPCVILSGPSVDTPGEVKTGKWVCGLKLHPQVTKASSALAGARGWFTRKSSGQP